MKRLVFLMVAVLMLLGTAAMADNWFYAGSLGTDAALAYKLTDFSLSMFHEAGSFVDQANNVAYVASQVSRDAGKIMVIDLNTLTVTRTITTLGAASSFVKAADGNIYYNQNQRHSTGNTTTNQGGIYKIDAVGGTYATTRVAATQDYNAAKIDRGFSGLSLSQDGTKLEIFSPTSAIDKYTTLLEMDIAIPHTLVRRNDGVAGTTSWGNENGWYNQGINVGYNAGNSVTAQADAGNVWTTTWNGVGGHTTYAATAGLQDGLGIQVYDAARNNYFQIGHGKTGTTALVSIDGHDGDAYLGQTAPVAADYFLAHAAPGLDWNKTTGIWGSAAAVDASSGMLYYGLDSSSDFAHAYITHVWKYDISTKTMADGGIPNATGQVVSLSNYSIGGVSAMLAVTADELGNYKLYSTIPEPGSLLALGAGLIGLLGITRRRR